MAKKAVYNEESISQLKGADRVRLRPAVISARTVLRAVSTLYLRYFQIP